jgi:hypothetical protein
MQRTLALVGLFSVAIVVTAVLRSKGPCHAESRA